MKGVFMFLSAMAVVIVMGAMAASQSQGSDSPSVLGFGVRDYHNFNAIEIWTDPMNNCQYLVYTSYKQGGITPRLNATGTPFCPQEYKEIQ